MPKQLVVLIPILIFIISCQNRHNGQDDSLIVRTEAADTTTSAACDNPVAISFLDIDVGELCVREKEVGRRNSIQKIFKSLRLNQYQYNQFVRESKEYFDVLNIKPRQKYFTISKETDSSSVLQYLVFKASDYEYVIANCTDTTLVPYVNEQEPKKKRWKFKKQKTILYQPLQISFYEKNIDTTKIYFAAVIQKSLSKTLKENKLDPSLMEKLNVAFNGKYNVNKIRKGDTLQFIYDQLSINGQFLNYGHVQAICIKTRKKSIYAVDYFLKDDSSYQYVDDAGKYLKTSFLKSPLKKGGNIVSRFSLRRFHPILLVEKAHLGTDFAAPQGSPIIATASGVIEAAQFTQNNGNYVKIRHDRKYETQYLHMSRFARGIRRGVRVQQGQVIGYVGSTGLATGPHVCYRFWKHGAQVDPLREKLNVVRQVPKKELNDYLAYFSAVKQTLENIAIR